MTQTLEEIAKAAAAHNQKRVIHYFTVPKKLQGLGVARLGFVELTSREQSLASKRGGLDPIAIANEMAKEALRAVDDRVVSTSDGTADQAWDKMGAKLRNLCTTAYAAIHNPDDGDAQDFLNSKETAVR